MFGKDRRAVKPHHEVRPRGSTPQASSKTTPRALFVSHALVFGYLYCCRCLFGHASRTDRSGNARPSACVVLLWLVALDVALTDSPESGGGGDPEDGGDLDDLEDVAFIRRMWNI